ncbi:MAG: S-ribosylhomocysteine lyase [Rickettsiales bacterium]|jgi:S-ribosylhomocysteine lyase|nr:S-ribosylhomocysteine lyase [Rickettsiales bacterium]
MPEGKHIVKSFNLDHTKVKAPFIRLADLIVAPSGNDVITKLDIRFVQPNQEPFLDNPSLHTLEHLLSTYLREGGKYNIIDFSPMGCQTGFYLILFDKIDLNEFKEYLFLSLKKVLKSDNIPGDTEIECGNYKSHSLDGAKKWAKQFLDGDVKLLQ